MATISDYGCFYITLAKQKATIWLFLCFALRTTLRKATPNGQGKAYIGAFRANLSV